MTPATLNENAREEDPHVFRRIVFNPGILGGKPIVKGTRISVEFILELLASGGCIAEIVKTYPHLTVEDVRQAVLFAAANLKNDIFLSVDLP